MTAAPQTQRGSRIELGLATATLGTDEGGLVVWFRVDSSGWGSKGILRREQLGVGIARLTLRLGLGLLLLLIYC